MVHEPIVNSLVSKRIVDIFPYAFLPSPSFGMVRHFSDETKRRKVTNG